MAANSSELAARHLPAVVRELTAEGWHVEAEGKVYRSPGKLDIQVSSGVDWFELHGAVAFGDIPAQLPQLLAALRRGENVVKLGDGSFGVLPQQWLSQYGMLAGLGEAHGDHLRFKRSQTGLLDALLAAQPEARCDALFAQARDELRSFAGIGALDAPAGFTGDLRFTASVFKMTHDAERNPNEHTRKLLAQALRPFLLRGRSQDAGLLAVHGHAGNPAPTPRSRGRRL